MLSGRGLFGSFHFRKVDIRASDMIEVIGEQVHTDMGDDLDDIPLTETGVSNRLKCRVVYASTVLYNRFGKAQDNVRFVVNGASNEIIRQIVLWNPRFLSQESVGGSAVITPIDTGDS